MRLSGHVSALSAEVALVVLPPSGESEALVFLIDTGFLGALALPEPTIEALGLRTLGQTEATLADGSVRVSVVYEARLAWGEGVLRVAALAIGDRPLVGIDFRIGEPESPRVNSLARRGTALRA